MTSTVLVITNVPDREAARTIARALVEQRLAACVNVLPEVESVYRWQGAIEEAKEITLLIKTVTERYPELEAGIRQLHPYDVPEIIALPLACGFSPYLDWVAQETKKDSDA